MTRWNDDDLSGRLLEAMRTVEDADQWELVNYPALAEQHEYINEITYEITYEGIPVPDPPQHLQLFRSPGEALHPERFSEQALRKIRSNLQPRIWSALYQQNPVPDEGLYFQKDWFKQHDSFPSYPDCRVITAWDFAIGEKQHNDWTVGVTLMHDHRDNLYLLDVCRFRGDTFVILTEMLRVMRQFCPSTALIPPLDYVVGVEDGQIWRTLAPLLESELARERLPIVLHPIPALTDKMARARALQAHLQRGKFVIPPATAYDFVTPFVSELLRFPGGKHDDQVDAAAHAARVALTLQPPAENRRAPVIKSWRDRLKQLSHIGGTTHMSA
jgi:predicted phage terminase large subunit-like protein